MPSATPSPRPSAPSPASPGTRPVTGWLAGKDWTVIPTTRRVIALTFDAGANADAVPAILATLRRDGVPATFFLTGNFVHDFPAAARSIATGSFRALGGLLRGPLDPVTAFAFVSHKLLRWTLPFLLIGMLVTSAALVESPLYRALFVLQVLFYAWGLVGYLFRSRIQGIRFGLVAYYLLAIHLAFLVGFVRYLSGRREIEWRQVH